MGFRGLRGFGVIVSHRFLGFRVEESGVLTQPSTSNNTLELCPLTARDLKPSAHEVLSAKWTKGIWVWGLGFRVVTGFWETAPRSPCGPLRV